MKVHIRRYFSDIFLAFCSLNALAAAPVEKTVECTVIEVADDQYPDFLCTKTKGSAPSLPPVFAVRLQHIWAYAQKEKGTRLLRKWIYMKTVSVQSPEYTPEGGKPVVTGTVYLDGKDIGLELLRAGYARVLSDSKNTAYHAAQKQAQQQKAGVWDDLD
jgi:endonuclease YncB( thermonuclease family)